MQHFLWRKIDSFLCVDPSVHQSLSMFAISDCEQGMSFMLGKEAINLAVAHSLILQRSEPAQYGSKNLWILYYLYITNYCSNYLP